MTETHNSRSLHRKIAEIVQAVGNVAEDGYNSQHKYRYVSEAAFLRALRTEMANRFVTVYPQIVDGTLRTDARTDGGKGTITTCVVAYTFTDGESGESFTSSVASQGFDTLDKGAFKAMTGAIKYVLRQTFMIPTGDDAEQSDRAPSAGAAASGRPTADTVPLPEGVYTGAIAESAVRKKGQKTLWLVVGHVPSSKGGPTGEAKKWLDLDDADQTDEVEALAMALEIVSIEDLGSKNPAAEVEGFNHATLAGRAIDVAVSMHGDNRAVQFSAAGAAVAA